MPLIWMKPYILWGHKSCNYQTQPFKHESHVQATPTIYFIHFRLRDNIENYLSTFIIRFIGLRRREKSTCLSFSGYSHDGIIFDLSLPLPLPLHFNIWRGESSFVPARLGQFDF